MAENPDADPVVTEYPKPNARTLPHTWGTTNGEGGPLPSPEAVTKLGGWYKDSRAKPVFLPTSVWATGAPHQWRQGNFGQGVTVAVLDTGIDASHPALKGQVLRRISYVNEPVVVPHGTHVAGLIAGTGGSSGGEMQGMAPGAKLIDYHVLGKNGGSYANISAAIRHAANSGADIISMSLGGPSRSKTMEDAIKYAVHEKQCLVVCAGGNEQGGRTVETIGYPAYFSDVVAVSCVEFADGKVTRSYFSNVNREIDMCADGYRVVSSVIGGGYEEMSGTSMAAPIVSGFAALCLNKARTVIYNTPHSELALYAMVKSNTVDLSPNTDPLRPISNEDPTRLGIDWLYGAGFCTFYPSVPTRTQAGGPFTLPHLADGSPV